MLFIDSPADRNFWETFPQILPRVDHAGQRGARLPRVLISFSAGSSGSLDGRDTGWLKIRCRTQTYRIGGLWKPADRLGELPANRLVTFVSFPPFPPLFCIGYSFLRVQLAITTPRNCSRRDGCCPHAIRRHRATKLPTILSSGYNSRDFWFLRDKTRETSIFPIRNFLSCNLIRLIISTFGISVIYQFCFFCSH